SNTKPKFVVPAPGVAPVSRAALPVGPAVPSEALTQYDVVAVSGGVVKEFPVAKGVPPAEVGYQFTVAPACTVALRTAGSFIHTVSPVVLRTAGGTQLVDTITGWAIQVLWSPAAQLERIQI